MTLDQAHDLKLELKEIRNLLKENRNLMKEIGKLADNLPSLAHLQALEERLSDIGKGMNEKAVKVRDGRGKVRFQRA